jgi:hypothetical protein
MLPIADSAVANVSKPYRNPGSSFSPAGVNASGRGRRRNSFTPQCSSRSRSSAASLKLNLRAAASKARSALSGGKRLMP